MSRKKLHPHVEYQTVYVELLAAALFGPLLLMLFRDAGPYTFALEQLYLAAVVWWGVLRLPTSSTKEGGALTLGVIFALMHSAIPLTDIYVVMDLKMFLFSLFVATVRYTASVIIMTVPALRSRSHFMGGVIVALLLNFVFQAVLQ